MYMGVWKFKRSCHKIFTSLPPTLLFVARLTHVNRWLTCIQLWLGFCGDIRISNSDSGAFWSPRILDKFSIIAFLLQYDQCSWTTPSPLPPTSLLVIRLKLLVRVQTKRKTCAGYIVGITTGKHIMITRLGIIRGNRIIPQHVGKTYDFFCLWKKQLYCTVPVNSIKRVNFSDVAKVSFVILKKIRSKLCACWLHVSNVIDTYQACTSRWLRGHVVGVVADCADTL